MSRPIIEVHNLSKKYRLGVVGATTLREDLARVTSRLRGREQEAEKGEFWALRNVSFSVQPGEVVGIIGRNGAGKSTLLKLLSRITEPTSGRAVLRGRVASLLEVGTGFHPELTGRDNVFLNGAILGMKLPEVRAKFDEIVTFAEVERFIDTPVKHYSSGMYVRLAFAVAAHLDPDILIIDEVLAVGDVQFQKKCLGKMSDIAGQGRTILFVSHNTASIQRLCQRGIWLRQGCLAHDGPVQEVVDASMAEMTSATDDFPALRSHDGEFIIRRIILRNGDGEETTQFTPGQTMVVELHFDARVRIEAPYFWFGIATSGGSLFGANMLLDGHRPPWIEGPGLLRARFPSLPLMPQRSCFLSVGMRYRDGRTLVFPSTEVAHFHIAGAPESCGFASEVAAEVVAASAPLLVPYSWELPDGTVHAVGAFSDQARKAPSPERALRNPTASSQPETQ